MSRRARCGVCTGVALLLGCAPGLLGGCRCRESTATTLREARTAEARRALPGPHLLRGLEHREPAARARVALALGRIGLASGEVLGQLERRLTDSAPRVRQRAIFALRLLVLDTPAALGREAVARRVSRRLLGRLGRERDARCRAELQRSLGWVAPTKLAAKLGRALAEGLTRPAERGPALSALAALSARGALRLTPALLQGLAATVRRGSLEERTLAAMVVARAGGARSDALVRELRRAGEAEDATLARWATRAVGSSDASKETLDWLARRYRDHRPEVQIAAAEGLARKNAGSRERLARLLLRVWRSVSASHFRLTGPRLQPVLRSLELLSRLDGPCGPDTRAAATTLLELTDVTDSTVDYGKKEALAVDLVHCAAARLADLCSGELTFAPRCGTAGAAWMTRDMRRAVVARTVASQVMSETKGAAWQVEQLSALARDGDPRVRAAALAALAQVPISPVENKRTTALLAAGLAMGDPRPVAAAADAVVALWDRLGSRRVRELEQPLLRALRRQTSPTAGCRLARALGRHRDARAALQLALSSPAVARGIGHCAVRDLEPAARPQKLMKLLGTIGSRAGLQGRSGPGERQDPDAKLPGRAKVVTTRGVVWLRLLTDEAPGAVRRLVAALEDRRRYRRARIRWADPLARLELEPAWPASKRPAGERPARGVDRPPPSTAPRRTPIPCVLTPAPFEKGSVGLGLPAGRDSSQGELVFCLERRPELDGRITRVAEVEPGGLEVLRWLLPGDWVKGIYLHRPGRK